MNNGERREKKEVRGERSEGERMTRERGRREGGGKLNDVSKEGKEEKETRTKKM